jgi:hypothetical protein
VAIAIAMCVESSENFHANHSQLLDRDAFESSLHNYRSIVIFFQTIEESVAASLRRFELTISKRELFTPLQQPTDYPDNLHHQLSYSLVNRPVNQ